MGAPVEREDYLARFGNENWSFDLSVDVAFRYGRGRDEQDQALDDVALEVSPSLDVELNWLEDWLEQAFNERFRVQLTASREDFRASGDLDDSIAAPKREGDQRAIRRDTNSSLRLRQERLTFSSGEHRVILDLNNGATFLGALTAPVTGLRQVIGPTLGLAPRELATANRAPIVTPVESRGVTKLVYARSWREDRSLSRRRRTTDGFAMSVALERFKPTKETTVDRPIEIALWRTMDILNVRTRMSGIYSWGNANGVGQDIESWGFGSVSTVGRWQIGGSYADHGSSLQVDGDVEAYGATYGVRRQFAGPLYPFTLAASGAYTRSGSDEYRAYSVGGEWRVRNGMVVSLDASLFNDERVARNDYGFVVMTEVRVRPRWGSVCKALGLYVNGRDGC